MSTETIPYALPGDAEPHDTETTVVMRCVRHLSGRALHSAIYEHRATGILMEQHIGYRNGEPTKRGSSTCFYHPDDPDTHETFRAAADRARELRLLGDPTQ